MEYEMKPLNKSPPPPPPPPPPTFEEGQFYSDPSRLQVKYQVSRFLKDKKTPEFINENGEVVFIAYPDNLILVKPRAPAGGRQRKSKKSRKSRKSRKFRKSRKSRKSKKH